MVVLEALGFFVCSDLDSKLEGYHGQFWFKLRYGWCVPTVFVLESGVGL